MEILTLFAAAIRQRYWLERRGLMYHCDACGWDGSSPTLREWRGEGCSGVVWTWRVCPTCGEEVYQVVVPREPWPEGGAPNT